MAWTRSTRFSPIGQRATVTDVEGRELINFIGASRRSGYPHLNVVATVKEQLIKCFQALAYEPYVKLRERSNEKRAEALP